MVLQPNLAWKSWNSSGWPLAYIGQADTDWVQAVVVWRSNAHHRLQDRNAWLPVDDTVWRGGTASLEKCVTASRL